MKSEKRIPSPTDTNVTDASKSNNDIDSAAQQLLQMKKTNELDSGAESVANQAKKGDLKRKQAPSTKKITNTTAITKLAVGDRISIYWEGTDHNCWYDGTVTAEKPNRLRCLRISYDDGDTEWINPNIELIKRARKKHKQKDMPKRKDKNINSGSVASSTRENNIIDEKGLKITEVCI